VKLNGEFFAEHRAPAAFRLVKLIPSSLAALNHKIKSHKPLCLLFNSLGFSLQIFGFTTTAITTLQNLDKKDKN
jgi:hypothetical protein